MISHQWIEPPFHHTGRHAHLEAVVYAVEGSGTTDMQGKDIPWEAGDVLNLPTRRDGITVQHFNDDPDQRAAFLAVEPNLFAATSVDRGCGFELIEPAPDYGRTP